MRPRIVVPVTLLVLALPIAASAGMRTPGDGTLSVRDLDGYVLVQAKGGVIGRCDQCSLFVNELRGAEEILPVVSGARGIDIDQDDASERFRGKDLRWKVIGPFENADGRGFNVAYPPEKALDLKAS